MNHLTGIYIYPIKSLGGISLQTSAVEERGLQYDRRWMLVDEHQQFLTQRKYPRMALLKTELTPAGLRVYTADQPDLLVPFQPASGDTLRVTVWDDTVTAVTVSGQADAWFSRALGMPCRLVYMPEESVRPVDPRYAVADNYVSFADGYPFLLLSEGSLTDLNSRLAEPLPMNRFRPNLVVSSREPFAEDGWYEVRIGECVFFGVKPCARCVLTTIDQDTAQKGREPLQTLSTYRAKNNKIYFGQNAVYGGQGSTVRVGDRVEVISRR